MATINSERNGRPCWQPRHDRQGSQAFLVWCLRNNSGQNPLPRMYSCFGDTTLARPGCLCLSLIGLFTASWLAFSENISIFAQRAEKHFQEARKKFQASTNDLGAAWQFGRACFDWADFAKNDHQRESIAGEGIAACRRVIAEDPKSVPGHYYLAMNLGQLAQTKTLGALTIVDEMEREFKTVRDLDAKFDCAGPDRNLGLLYFEAPGWPASIGSKARARQHLLHTGGLSQMGRQKESCARVEDHGGTPATGAKRIHRRGLGAELGGLGQALEENSRKGSGAEISCRHAICRFVPRLAPGRLCPVKAGPDSLRSSIEDSPFFQARSRRTRPEGCFKAGGDAR